MTADSQDLLRSMVGELRYGAGVRQSNSITDPNAPGEGWNTSNGNFVIIIAIPAKDSNGDYIIDPLTAAPYLNELVYYKNGSTLYRRSLADENAIDNNLVTSCPIATSSCPKDIKLVEHIDTIIFNLYDQDDASTSDVLQAKSINIYVSLVRPMFGEDVRADNNMRITLRNTIWD